MFSFLFWRKLKTPKSYFETDLYLLQYKKMTDLSKLSQCYKIVPLLLQTFCQDFLILGIRKELYVWCIETEELVKTLDAHFARIVEIHQLTMPGWNAVITASIDRTVKVWNINYIFEPEHHIDRHKSMI